MNDENRPDSGERLDLKDISANDSSKYTDDPNERNSNRGMATQVAANDNLDPVYHVPVRVSAILGQTRIKISDLLNINKGQVIKLNRKVGEAIEVFVNDRLVARGEVVLVNNKIGVTMTEIIKAGKDN